MITQRDESMMMIRFVYIIAYLAELLCKTDRRRSRFNRFDLFDSCARYKFSSFIHSWPLTLNIIEKPQFITLLTAIVHCIVSHIENSKNDKGYIT